VWPRTNLAAKLQMPNPNRKPFPRRSFVERDGLSLNVHPFKRQEHTAYYMRKNRKGWRHDLGAQDVFLDNFGLLFKEQVSRDVFDRHMQVLDEILMRRWELLETQVLPDDPWWGTHFNSVKRDANSGEPRGLLRFMGDRNWAAPLAAMSLEPEQADEELPSTPRRFSDWTSSPLVPEDGDFGSPVAESRFVAGVPLPEGWPKFVDQVRVLPPWAATPDLPLRVGDQQKDLELYEGCIRNQGRLGTCAANAMATALDVAARRFLRARGRHEPSFRFSAAWIHAKTGVSRRDGRQMSTVADFVSRSFLCSEEICHYPSDPTELEAWADSADMPAEGRVAREHRRMAKVCGRLVVRRLQEPWAPWDIPRLKAHLAAGWVVVAGASMPDEVHSSLGSIRTARSLRRRSAADARTGGTHGPW
jgi:hypothetical protein